MVEDLFEVEVERPFGEEISEMASGQTVGGSPSGGDPQEAGRRGGR
jgi:hypothetical protein